MKLWSCEDCKNGFVGDTNFEKQNILVHLNSDTLLLEKEFEELDEYEQQDIRCATDTQRKKDIMGRLCKRKSSSHL